MPLSPRYDKPKILATKWQMDISEDGYWKPRASNTSALSSPKTPKPQNPKTPDINLKKSLKQ